MVISLKSSTVSTTVEAYRRMASLVDYPLHIGITETGTPERGLIKSAAGIGALLLEGIGDTLRISLTDSPIQEVRAGVEILRALRLRRDDIEIVSCPTCGRTRVDLMQAVARVNAALPHECGYLRVASWVVRSTALERLRMRTSVSLSAMGMACCSSTEKNLHTGRRRT